MQNESCPHVLAWKTFIKCSVKFHCTLALHQNHSVNQPEFVIFFFFKLSSILWKCLGRPGMSHDPVVLGPVQRQNPKMMPVWRSWHWLHVRALNDTCIVFTARLENSGLILAGTMFSEGKSVSWKGKENANSDAAPCVEVQHISLPRKLWGAQHSCDHSHLHCYRHLPCPAMTHFSTARYFCTEVPFVVNFWTISQFHTGHLWK